jgi:hypothetical protein
MKQKLALLCFLLFVLTGFAYRTVYFYQDFSMYPVGSFNQKILPNNDDGTHGSNDRDWKQVLKDYKDRFFYLQYQKPLAVSDWQFGRCLKINTAQSGTVIFEARNLPVTGDRDFDLQYGYFIEWQYQVDPTWILFRNYSPSETDTSFERISVAYRNGYLTLSVALPGKTEFETVYSKKIYLSNAWHTFIAHKTGNRFIIIHDSSELFVYNYATTPQWPVARVELSQGIFSFDTLCLFNGR